MKNLLIGLVAFFVIGAMMRMSEKYTAYMLWRPGFTTGYTDLAVGEMEDGQHPGDNYAAVEESKTIILRTNLLPVRLVERDGKIIHWSLAWKMPGTPVSFYQPATIAEQELWLKHFQLDETS